MKIEAGKLAPVLLAIHLVALPMYPRLPVYVLLMIALFTACTLWMISPRGAQPGRLLRYLFAGLVVVSLLFSYGTIFGQAPGTSMLLMLCFLKLFEMKGRRDIMIVIFLAYFLTASHFFHSQSPWMALFVFIVVTYLTTLLVIFSDRMGSTTFRMRLRLSGVMMLQAMPLMLILFVLFPRVPGPLWSVPDPDQGAHTGISDEMTPGSINNLIASGEVAFRVQFEAQPPPHAALYWRGLVLSDYDGRTWRRNDAPGSARPDIDYNNAQAAEIHAYTVTLEPHNQKWLYSLERLVAYEHSFHIGRELQVMRRKAVTDVTIYSMQSSLQALNQGLFEPERIKNLQLPSGLNPQTAELARQLLQQAGGDPLAMVQAVLSYFRQQGFIYSLSPPLLGNDAMDDFLFETRNGFCEHFSSAFVYLMRAAGVPARVVVGYQGGRRNPLDDYLIVRQSDAHAWAEVWLEQRGWVRVDPTAAVSPGRIDRGIQDSGVELALLPSVLLFDNSVMQRTRYLWDSMHHSWNQWVVGFNQKKQKQLFRQIGMDNVSSSTLLLWLVVGMSLCGGLLALWVFRRPVGARRDRVRFYYDKFCSRLEKAGIQKAPHEGPREFLMRAIDFIPDLKNELSLITGTYLELRYGPAGNALLEKRFVRSVKHLRVRKMRK